MKDETIEDQNELIEIIEAAGYNVVRVETEEYDLNLGNSQKTIDVDFEISVSKEYVEDEESENPYRVK